jgi:hypothetical protein
MIKSGHLWAVGYDDLELAEQVRAEIGRTFSAPPFGLSDSRSDSARAPGTPVEHSQRRPAVVAGNEEGGRVGPWHVL